MKLPLHGTSSTIKTLKEQFNWYQMWFWEDIQKRILQCEVFICLELEDSKPTPLGKQAIKEKSELLQLKAKTLSLPNTKQTTFYTFRKKLRTCKCEYGQACWMFQKEPMLIYSQVDGCWMFQTIYTNDIYSQ